ncbi:MAG: ATP-binding protein [Propionibacteriaceae bacterium]|nr:ATP-binding protein [Propionibacteriaceae bacterium]
MTRNISPVAAEALDYFPVVSIQGVRRAGKSTLAQALVGGRDHTVVTLDDDEVRLAATRDPNLLLEPARAGQTMVIDEIQRVPNLVLAVKSIVDRDKRPGAFVLTGSSDFLRLPGIPDSLAGRAVTIRLRPFSQGELNGRKDDFVTRVLQGMDGAGGYRSEVAREDYLTRAWEGGYPEALGLKGRWRAVWLDSYVERMTSRDAQSISERVSAERLRAVLRLLAANQAGELVKARLAVDAGISNQSVTSCVDTLRTLFRLETIPPFSANLTKREVGRAKALIADPGLASHLARVSLPQLLGDSGGGWAGHCLEGFVGTELLKQQSWSDTRWNLAHYRDRNKLEVDLVVELEDDRVILIEVKSSTTYRAEDFSGIERLAFMLGERLAAGIVLNTSRHGWRYSEKLVGLPISALWQTW